MFVTWISFVAVGLMPIVNQILTVCWMQNKNARICGFGRSSIWTILWSELPMVILKSQYPPCFLVKSYGLLKTAQNLWFTIEIFSLPGVWVGAWYPQSMLFHVGYIRLGCLECPVFLPICRYKSAQAWSVIGSHISFRFVHSSPKMPTLILQPN